MISIFLALCTGWIVQLKNRLPSRGRTLFILQLVDYSLLGSHLALQLLVFLKKKNERGTFIKSTSYIAHIILLPLHGQKFICLSVQWECDRLCDLVVRVLGYRSGGLGSVPGTTRKKKSSGSRTGSTQPRDYN
jgi:hypothetical protein